MALLDLQVIISFAIGVAFLSAVFIPLERCFPRVRTQKVLRASFVNDYVHLVLNFIVGKIVTLVVIVIVYVAVFRVLLNQNFQDKVAAQPLWLQTIEAIVLAEWGFYWSHRLTHKIPVLWTLHSVHHSIKEMDWLASARLHPLDSAFNHATSILPLIICGFTRATFGAYLVFTTFYSLFIHSNIRWTFGPLRYVLGTPMYHHWHHANLPSAYDKNFAAILPFVDMIHGTYKAPENWPERYGVDDPVPNAETTVAVLWWEQMVYPFRQCCCARQQPSTPPTPAPTPAPASPSVPSADPSAAAPPSLPIWDPFARLAESLSAKKRAVIAYCEGEYIVYVVSALFFFLYRGPRAEVTNAEEQDAGDKYRHAWWGHAGCVYTIGALCLMALVVPFQTSQLIRKMPKGANAFRSLLEPVLIAPASSSTSTAQPPSELRPLLESFANWSRARWATVLAPLFAALWGIARSGGKDGGAIFFFVGLLAALIPFFSARRAQQLIASFTVDELKNTITSAMATPPPPSSALPSPPPLHPYPFHGGAGMLAPVPGAVVIGAAAPMHHDIPMGVPVASIAVPVNAHSIEMLQRPRHEGAEEQKEAQEHKRPAQLEEEDDDEHHQQQQDHRRLVEHQRLLVS